jgi:hypothetical protein
MVVFPPSIDWRLSNANSDQFTIEAFVRLNGFGSPFGCIVCEAGLGVTWDFSTLPTGEFRFRFVNNASAIIEVDSTGASLTTATWYHLAVDKDATGKIRIYKNGTMFGSATPADSTFFNSNDDLMIGAAGILAGAPMNGWVDELRITKGLARYASDSGFSPPTAPFQRQ